MLNLLASHPNIALNLYKGFSFYILESRQYGIYIPILGLVQKGLILGNKDNRRPALIFI